MIFNIYLRFNLLLANVTPSIHLKQLKFSVKDLLITNLKKNRILIKNTEDIKMRKLSYKQRMRDVRQAYIFRLGVKKLKSNGKNKQKLAGHESIDVNKWIDDEIKKGLPVQIINGRNLQLTLPEVMNFSSVYDETVRCLIAIRYLTSHAFRFSVRYRLKRVIFSQLRSISTSAALSLTAELSKWEDGIKKNLIPKIETWDRKILAQFYELGFFELFKGRTDIEIEEKSEASNIKYVRYFKGHHDDAEKAKILRQKMNAIVGEDIKKWHLLFGGLSEAITNVCHHAYPENVAYRRIDKRWYMTGSYDSDGKILKVVFLDQGKGIPKTLPSSILYEKVVDLVSRWERLAGFRDATFLRAAVEVERTQTGEDDRGKGLQDLLEFNRQRGEGYLSILSGRGLYNYSVKDGLGTVKTDKLRYPILGTVIIWSTKL